MRLIVRKLFAAFILVSIIPFVGGTSNAGAATTALIDDPNCAATQLSPGDDNSSDQIALPFDLTVFNQTFHSLYVNNNGNVTFAQPLGAYTPSNLSAVSQAIVAPFWADVDTRGSGTVTYGTTTYNGSPAFCVNWNSVGYFSFGSDLTNTFQLLLVQPASGVSYAVMNYGQVQWESGGASGGSRGLGGTSAAAGYSIGADAGESVQVTGSLTNGALIDGGTNSLVGHSRGSTILGRYVYSLGIYVALGDSYSSGESVSPYESGTDLKGTNECHRSQAGSWPELLAADPAAAPGPLTSYACSGAVLQDLVDVAVKPDGQWTEGAQLKELAPSGLPNPAIGVVTITIGGNDVGFANTLSACVHGAGNRLNSCQSSTTTRMKNGIQELTEGGSYTLAREGSGQGGSLPAKCKKSSKGCIKVPSLEKLIAQIRKLAPNAAIRVVGYPTLFAQPSSLKGSCRVGQFHSQAGPVYDYRINYADVNFLLRQAKRLNTTIADQVAAAQKYEQVKNVQFVDTSNALGEHTLCSNSDSWINGLYWDDGAFLWGHSSGSFHPTSQGQAAVEAVVAKSLAAR